MPSPSLLQLVGSKGEKQTKYAPIFTDRFFVGLWTNRNPLRSPLGTFYADGWHLGGTDALIAGENVELSPRLTICRRPGNVPFSLATMNDIPLTFYAFRTFGGTTYTIVDTPSTIFNLMVGSAPGIYGKVTGSGQSNFLGIGNTLYFGDGAEQKALDVNGGVFTARNWGISIGPFSNSVGPVVAGNGFDNGGTNPWANPGDVTNSGGFASASATGTHVHGSVPGFTNQLIADQYGFSISFSEIITGIVVTLTGYQNVISGSPAPTLIVTLLKNGAPVGNSKTMDLTAITGPIPLTFGSASDLWGTSFSPSDVNSTTFGVMIQGEVITGFGSATSTFFVQNVDIVIAGTGGPNVTTTTGSLNPSTGYRYVVSYGNSSSEQVSSSTPPSNLIKPVSQGVNVTLQASTDPQVNQIWVFRTADGGSTFLNLPNSPVPNTSGTFTDNAPDSELNIPEQAPINDANDPPPAGALDPVYYLGLVWVHVGNDVFFSRTPSAIVGITQESFPPGNVFSFPETVIRKIPINAGLLIFTTSNIYIILGQNTSNSVLYSAPFLNEYGIQSWNALYVDGTIIYFFTSDNRLIRLDPSSGVEDMGFPIGDQLATFVPSRVYVAYHSATSNDTALYIADGSTGWFRCNPNQAPDGQITGPVWSPFAFITGGLKALSSIETSPGNHQLMLGPTAANQDVLVRDSSYTTFTDNGTPYEANYTIGSIVLAQPGQAAVCRFITLDALKIGTLPDVSVSLGEILETNMHSLSGYVVNDPPRLPASTTLWNRRFYFAQTVGGNPPPPIICRHLQIQIDYHNDTVQNEIYSLTINGAILNER